jgi:hypothetical protein
MNHKITVFMYGHGFQDLDGHIWEIIYMEPSAINQGLKGIPCTGMLAVRI